MYIANSKAIINFYAKRVEKMESYKNAKLKPQKTKSEWKIKTTESMQRIENNY